MKLVISQSHEESCAKAAQVYKDLYTRKPDAKMALATGSTPLPLYAELARLCAAGEIDFSKARSVNLDEYCGLAPDHDQSYRYFMDVNLFNLINIGKANTFVADGLKDPAAAAKELEDKVFEGGAPDLQLLGIGHNGHIGFNEPGEFLTAESHPEAISERTIDANARWFKNRDEVPRLSLTMGMKSILAAKQIIMLASGAEKAPVMKGLLLGGEVTTHNPASFLKLHTDVLVFIDRELADAAGVK